MKKLSLAEVDDAVVKILESGQRLFTNDIFARMETDVTSTMVNGKIQKLYHKGILDRTVVRGKFAYHMPEARRPERPKRNDVRLHSLDGVNVTLPVEPWLANNAVSV